MTHEYECAANSMMSAAIGHGTWRLAGPLKTLRHTSNEMGTAAIANRFQSLYTPNMAFQPSTKMVMTPDATSRWIFTGSRAMRRYASSGTMSTHAGTRRNARFAI